MEQKTQDLVRVGSGRGCYYYHFSLILMITYCYYCVYVYSQFVREVCVYARAHRQRSDDNCGVSSFSHAPLL